MKKTCHVVLMTFKGVKVGDLTAVLVAQVSVDDSKPTEPDIDFIDILNIKYRGVDLTGYENWQKFKKFHMEMGIDYDKLLANEFDKVFTKEAICRELGHGC